MGDFRPDTTAVDPKYEETVTIHNREFQKFSVDHTIHLVPIDDEEAERLEHQNRVFNLIFDGRLIFPPIKNPRNVLDCGYGAASWAVEVAESYPDCEVVGVDISPHMKPDDTPDNFWPELDDINRPLAYGSSSFDLVQSRMVGGGINASRWPSYLSDIIKVLRPGGWVQMIECYYMCQSNNGSLTESHPLRRWSNTYISSLDGIKDPRAPLRLQALLTGAGFVEIEHKMIRLPLSGWPDGRMESPYLIHIRNQDARERRIGQENRENIHQALGNLAIFPFTRRLGMSIQAVRALVASASVDAANLDLKAYFPLYVCIGKKPVQ